jgi:hypothetical protein
MKDVIKLREYAEDCRRLAKRNQPAFPNQAVRLQVVSAKMNPTPI